MVVIYDSVYDKFTDVLWMSMLKSEQRVLEREGSESHEL